jgi:3'-5' exoribonuclease
MQEQVSIEAMQAPLDASLNGANGANGANGPDSNGMPSEPGSERPFVRDLAEGQEVAAAFAVRERERRTRRNGDDFLRLVLADRTGTVEAVAWEGVDELFSAAEPGSVVIVEGRFSVHPQYGAKITLRSLRIAAEDEYDHADLVEGPRVSLERLESDLRALIATIQSPHLRRLLDALLGEDAPGWPRFRDAPAAKYYHEAYRHGLLHHTVTMAQAVSTAASAFPGVDRDVAVTGALLHDIGKTRAYNDDPLAIDLTDAGRLQGEIALGYYIVRRAIESIEGFEPALAQAILHIILSHHGSYENGSPVVPATREATLVHAIDNLGGKLGSFDRIERELPDGEAWSRFDRGIDSAAYFPARAA